MWKKTMHFFETVKGKRTKNMIIGLGASVVLLGALFKIQHWPGAGPMLTIGMAVEAFIFALQGILPPHADFYWQKIYPRVDVPPMLDPAYAHSEALAEGTTVTQQLEGMMEDNKIESELIERLGAGLKKFGATVEGISDLTNATVATNEYTSSAKAASASLASMKTVYDGAANSVKELADSSSSAKEYSQQVQAVAKNLSSLNSMYELELQDTNNHMKAMNAFYGTLTKATDDMNASVEDARRYREEIARLANNLTSLNAVYGNMLAAMQLGAGPKK